MSATEALLRREIRRKRRTAPKGGKERSDDGREKETTKERTNEEGFENQIVMAAVTKYVRRGSNSFHNRMKSPSVLIVLF